MVDVQLDEEDLQAILHLLRSSIKPSYQLRLYLIEKFENAIKKLIEDESIFKPGQSLRD